MKRNFTRNLICFLLLAIFAGRDILPVITQVSWLTLHDVFAQVETENTTKGAETVKGAERTEYWIDHNTGSLLAPVLLIAGNKSIPADTYFEQSVYLPTPTPPPDQHTIL